MRFLKELFSENSTSSLMRVCVFITCCTANYIAIARGPDELGVITVLLTTAFGAKVLQKRVEMDDKNGMG